MYNFSKVIGYLFFDHSTIIHKNNKIWTKIESLDFCDAKNGVSLY